MPVKLPGLGGGLRQLASPPKEKISTPICSHLDTFCFYLDSQLKTVGFLSFAYSHFGTRPSTFHQSPSFATP